MVGVARTVFALTLTFEKAGTVEAEVVVRGIAAQEPTDQAISLFQPPSSTTERPVM